jgi:integrating conjugative element protein (TIGR03757 family)
MPTRFLRFLPLLFLAAFGLPAAAEVLAVTDSRHLLRTLPGARVVELDSPARIEAALSANLPADPGQALSLARRRVTDRDLQGRLRRAYQGVIEARNLKLIKIPAVVVDRRYVVYGEADVARAVARIAQYRRTRP